MRHIDILYANHWPEVVSLLAERVRPGDALVTEDAPSPEFAQMLAGDLPIDDYLMLTDIEFPEFGRRMCRLWQRLPRDVRKDPKASRRRSTTGLGGLSEKAVMP